MKTHGFSTAAMIGGAKGGSLNRFAMYGGTLTAVHGGSGAVIGGGNAAPASRYNGEGICFYGGTVDAKIADGSRGCGIGNGSGYSGTSPGSIAIYGGDIQATGKNGGAGIGGGQEAVNPAIDIYNGKVSASGIISYYTGAGIGSGQFAKQHNPIRIHGGTVVATGQSGAGIGAGCGGNAGTIEISNASVVSMSTAGGAGIGGGKRAKDKGGYVGNITISSGSKVVATSSDYGEAQDLVNRLDGYIDHSGMKTDDTAYAGGIVSIGAFKAWK